MKIKTAALVSNELRAAIRKVCTLPLDQRVALRIMSTIEPCNEAWEEYNDGRLAILEKNGIRDEDDNLVVNDRNEVQVDPEKMNTFIEGIGNISNKEIEIEGITLKDLQNAKLTINDLVALKPITKSD